MYLCHQSWSIIIYHCLSQHGIILFWFVIVRMLTCNVYHTAWYEYNYIIMMLMLTLHSESVVSDDVYIMVLISTSCCDPTFDLCLWWEDIMYFLFPSGLENVNIFSATNCKNFVLKKCTWLLQLWFISHGRDVPRWPCLMTADNCDCVLWFRECHQCRIDTTSTNGSLLFEICCFDKGIAGAGDRPMSSQAIICLDQSQFWDKVKKTTKFLVSSVDQKVNWKNKPTCNSDSDQVIMYT